MNARIIGKASKIGPLLLSLLLAIAAACGSTSRSDDSTTTPVAGTSNTTATSAVADPVAQSLLITTNVNNVVSAVSDGGTGSNGGGGGGAGLVSLFNDDRSCATTSTSSAITVTTASGATLTVPANTPYTTITRSFTGTLGATTYSTNSDGSASGETDVWYPGGFFGMQNITPDSVANYGTVPVPKSGNAVPTPTAVSGAAAGSSGVLGSVGFRSQDGSWNGAPVWEVANRYVGTGNLAVSKTEGMVMYYTSNMPTVTAATTAPSVGGTYAPLAMVTAKTLKATDFSVLGQFANGALPSFTDTGIAVIDGVETAVGQAGTVTAAGLPGKLYNPPTVLSCADKANAKPGWRFSQNVAGLTVVITNKQTYTATHSKGSFAVTWTGGRTLTWSDPALIAPFTNTPSAPYFDENAGALSLTRTAQIGTKAAPNTGTLAFTPTGGSAGPTTKDTSYSSVPFLDTVTRDLNNGWVWTTKTITSGEMTTTHSIGSNAPIATAVTTFADVVWKYNATAEKACVPVSGLITTVITPTDTTQQVSTIIVRFGTSITISSAPSGVSSTRTCAAGATASTTSPATNCTAIAEADNASYKPTGCNF